jgi:hypothetical protein
VVGLWQSSSVLELDTQTQRRGDGGALGAASGLSGLPRGPGHDQVTQPVWSVHTQHALALYKLRTCLGTDN